jgi:TatD DNase family protein
MLDPAPELIDYHCHLDLYKNHAKQFEICEQKRIATLAVTTTPRAWSHNRDLAEGSRFVRVALGLHPQLVGQIAQEITIFEQLLPSTRFVGEVGLDASPAHYATFEKQKTIFTRVLKACAGEGGKILSVHSVRTGQIILDLIEEHLPQGQGRIVFHWFSGSSGEARRAAGLGCYFSLNKEMFRNPNRKQLIGSLPFDRILTETDGPFVSTEKGPSEPSDTSNLIPLIADAFQKEAFEVKARLLQNLCELEAPFTGSR